MRTLTPGVGASWFLFSERYNDMALKRAITKLRTTHEGSVAEPKLKAVKGTEGLYTRISGYAWQWGVIDKSYEYIEATAFNKSIADKLTSGKIYLCVDHQWRVGGGVVGLIDVAKVDDYGLYIEGRLSAIPLAQQTAQLVDEGVVKAFSVGFFGIKAEYKPHPEGGENRNKPDVLHHTELNWTETSLCMVPMNEGAGVSSVHSIDAETDYPLASPGRKWDPPSSPDPDLCLFDGMQVAEVVDSHVLINQVALVLAFRKLLDPSHKLGIRERVDAITTALPYLLKCDNSVVSLFTPPVTIKPGEDPLVTDKGIQEALTGRVQALAKQLKIKG